MDDFDRADIETMAGQVIAEHHVIHAAQLAAVYDATYLGAAQALDIPKPVTWALLAIRVALTSRTS